MRKKKFILGICIIIILLCLVLSFIIKTANYTPLWELKNYHYKEDPCEFVEEYISAINNKDMYKVFYMEGKSIENLITESYQRSYDSTPNIINISIDNNNLSKPTVTVTWERRYLELNSANFNLKWNADRNMWNIISFGF